MMFGGVHLHVGTFYSCIIIPPPSKKKKGNKFPAPPLDLKLRSLCYDVHHSAELNHLIVLSLFPQFGSTTVKANNFGHGRQISPIVFYGSPHGVPPKRPISLLRLLHEIRIDLAEQQNSNLG